MVWENGEGGRVNEAKVGAIILGYNTKRQGDRLTLTVWYIPSGYTDSVDETRCKERQQETQEN